MKNNYEYSLRLRVSDFDINRNIKPSSVLDLFQEAASAHADVLGIGFSSLSDKNLLWVVTKVKFKILKMPEMHSSVTVRTWPLKPDSIKLQREYVMHSQSGEPLIVGTSEWVLMDAVSRRIAPSKDIYPFEVFCSDTMFEQRLVKVSDFAETDFENKTSPAFCDLDMNGHVNNIKYADYVLNALPVKNEQIKSFQLDFHKELKIDTELNILIKALEDGFVCKGLNEADEKMFFCEIKTK